MPGMATSGDIMSHRPASIRFTWCTCVAGPYRITPPLRTDDGSARQTMVFNNRSKRRVESGNFASPGARSRRQLHANGHVARRVAGDEREGT